MLRPSLLAAGLVGLLATAPAQAEPPVFPYNVPEVSGVKLTMVAGGLERPWGMTWLPNGDMLITEKAGRLRLLRDGQMRRAPIAGVPVVLSSGQGGLLDVAVHPDFEANSFVYLSYSAGDREENATRVARARFDGERLNDLEVIFEARPLKRGTAHYGSRLLFLPDRTLLISVGDGGNPPISYNGEFIRLQSQNLDSRLGRLLRINDDGTIPDDNPFVSDPAADSASWTYGNRNIQGLARDPVTGQVWANEHGSRGGDEINRMAPGNNYGWPLATYSEEYSGGQISPYTELPGMVTPIVVWTPSIAPSGMAVYRGAAIPEWQGDLFSGGLRSQDVRRTRLDSDGNVLGEERIRIGARVRDVAEGPDGHLYILTDEGRGRLIRIDPAS